MIDIKALIFEYGGYHFTPFMKLTGKAGEFMNMAMGANHNATIIDESRFSYKDFYTASPIKECDLFKCVENGKIYIPAYNLLEYTGELHGINPCFAKKNRDYER